MRDEVRVCGTCAYNTYNTLDRGGGFYYCGNKDSDYYCDPTHHNDDCELWQNKEK